MTKQNNKAFTLVELIVVITILAVLATVAFISFQGYTSSSRDSVRLADLKNISKSFEINRTKDIEFPLPDKKVDISASGTIFQHQGELSQNILEKNLNIFDGGIDPVTKKPYGYAVNLARNKFQIIGFLENSENVANISTTKTFANNSDKFVKSSGDSLGILLNETTNEVIVQSGSISEIDIQTNTQTYGLIESGNNITHPSISSLKGMFDYRYNPIASCKSILLHGNSKGNGIYSINPTGITGEEFDVYCDMVTDGGGWTIIAGNGLKFGHALDLNTTNPNLDNYNMPGNQLEEMIVNKGWKEYQYKIGYNNEDVTVNFQINIDSEKINLGEGETSLCFADKSINYTEANENFLNHELAPYTWATYNGGKLLYSKRKNDILRVKMFCEGDNYGFNHIKTIIGEHSSQHLTSDSYEFDGSKRSISQFYISVDYLDPNIKIEDLPTFGNNLKWAERGTVGSWNHYYLSNLSADFSDGLEYEEISYESPDWEGAPNLKFNAYMMLR